MGKKIVGNIVVRKATLATSYGQNRYGFVVLLTVSYLHPRFAKQIDPLGVLAKQFRYTLLIYLLNAYE